MKLFFSFPLFLSFYKHRDWRRWPWNPEWEWGALQVVPRSMLEVGENGGGENGGGEEEGEYREDWGVWDDMDITDDENDKQLVRSSSDNTATDDEEEEREYRLEQTRQEEDSSLEQVSGGGGGGSGGGSGGSGSGSVDMLSSILHKAVSGRTNSVTQSTPMLLTHQRPLTPNMEEEENYSGGDENDDEEEGGDGDGSGSGGTFLTRGLGGHAKSQPNLLPSVGGSNKERLVSRTKIIRSQSSLHLGHYQFGDQTASILSKSLSSNFDAQKSPLPRRLTRLDQPGKK